MTIEVGVIVTLVALILTIGIAWGTLRSEVHSLRADVKRLSKILEDRWSDAQRDIDGTDLHHRERWHEHDRAIRDLQLDLTDLRARQGIPAYVPNDRTPVHGIPHRAPTGPHRRTAEDSG